MTMAIDIRTIKVGEQHHVVEVVMDGEISRYGVFPDIDAAEAEATRLAGVAAAGGSGWAQEVIRKWAT